MKLHGQFFDVEQGPVSTRCLCTTLRVDEVAQAVTEEVEAEHREH